MVESRHTATCAEESNLSVCLWPQRYEDAEDTSEYVH